MKSIMLLSAFCVLVLGLAVNTSAQWVQTRGPEGGDFYSISLINEMCYTVQGINNPELYSSADLGQSWRIITPTGIFPRKVLATDGYLFLTSSSGILRSTDSGSNWEFVNNGISYLSYISLTRSGNTLFAASDQHVYRSDDFGMNWTPVFYQQYGDLNVILSVDTFLLVSRESDTYRSTDFGNTWIRVNELTRPASIASTGSRIFVAAYNGLFYTTNFGANWTSATASLPSNSVSSLTAQGQALLAGSSFDGIYKSTDQGISWFRSSTGLMSRKISPNCLVSNDSIIIASTSTDTSFSGGVYFSGDNAANWERRTDGIFRVRVSSIGSSGGIILAGSTSGIHRSSDAGESWQFITHQYGINNVNFFRTYGQQIYAGTANGLFASSDLGNNWTDITGDIPKRYIVSLGKVRDTLFLSNSDGIYASGNEGVNWTLKTGQLKYAKDFPVIEDRIFTSRFGVYYSDNSGTNWTLCGLENKNIYYLTMFGDRLVAGTSSYGIYYSTDRGTTWQVSSSEIKSEGYAISGSTMIAGLNISTDYGATWESFGLGYPETQALQLSTLTISNNFVYSGTQFSSVWKRSLSPPLNDVGVTGILTPGTDSVHYGGCITGNRFYPKIKIKNFGSENQTQAFGIEFKIYKDSSLLYSDLITDTIGAFQTHEISFSEFASTAGDTGRYNIWVSTLLESDSVVQNNSMTSSFRVMNANAGVEPYRGDAAHIQYHFANSTPEAACTEYIPDFRWEDTTGSTSLISNGVPSIPLFVGNADDGYFNVPGILGGSSFNFYYSNYETFNISTNGIIAFGGYGIESPNPAPIVGADPVAAVFPFWYNLDFTDPDVTGRNLKYKLFPDRLVVTYDRVPAKNPNYDPEDYVSFQAMFWFQGAKSGVVQFQYDSTLTGQSFQRKMLADSIGPHSVGINYRTEYFQHGIEYRQVNANRICVTPGTVSGSSLSVAFSPNETVLPVELSTFTCSVTGNNVILNWSTVVETQNTGFEVERAFESSQWFKIGFVPSAGAWNSHGNYEFKDNYLNSGTYRYRLKQLDVNGNFEYHQLNEIIDIGIPGRFRLSQNYPNPFNPTTKINYDIAVGGRVRITVYDVSGREIATLVNEVKTAGYYTVEFDASNLSSGTYFCRISAEGKGQNFSDTKKMVVIK